MEELKEIIRKMILEIEQKEKIVNVKGGRGGGTGTVYADNTVGVLKMLGHEEGKEKEEYQVKPVKISKVFQRNKK